MSSTRREAALLRAAGLALCRIEPGQKRPIYSGWSSRSLDPDAFGPRDQVGILGGPLSNAGRPDHALVIIDLDSLTAVRVADDYLAATGMVEGRWSKPRSHRYYLVPFGTIPEWAHSKADQAAKAAIEAAGHPGPFLKSFADRETRAEVIRFIGTGGQAVCPPSAHPTGEPRVWAGVAMGEPAVVDFRQLWDAVGQLASACGAEIPRVVMARPRTSAHFLRRPGEARPITRAQAYLAKVPGAVCGQGGHKAAFWAARVLVTGFMLPVEDALRLLLEHWNPRCRPEWSEEELRHKVEDANRLPFTDKPEGWLLTNARPASLALPEGARR